AQEIEESQLEPAQNVIPENDDYLTQDSSEVLAEEPASSEENSEETADTAATEEAPAEETAAEEAPKKRRRYTRRQHKKAEAPKTMADATGTDDESIEEDCVDDDDDEDTDSETNEYNFDLQRKLLRARKLFHRSTIQDVIKEGQTLLIQVVKEERGNKGAACTTYISLAGRYCVLMPNRIKSGGVSRKITNANDRKRLKGIIKELPLNPEMSLIVRTAGEDKTKADIVRDYNYLIRTWNAIRYSALRNQPPAIIYEEGNLIKRALRDMYTKDISEVIIDGDAAYQTARNFVKILSPHNLRHIKCRRPGEAPVFQRFQIEAQLDKLHNPIVQLESGGYLVINPTEALVSIDVNSGRATKEKDIEETALKTNLEAADEIAKQLKMRDLAGLVVVDFIDMYEQQNNIAVEKRMKEAMKDDRARIQIAKMSIFGLLEISRQRMHSSFMESNYETCPYCQGHGVVRTIESGATLILRAIEGEAVRGQNMKITVTVPADIAAYLLNQKRKQLSALEEQYKICIIVAGDTSLKDVADFKIEREKLPNPTVCKEAAATCYETDNVEINDEPEESCETPDEENGTESRRFRKGGRSRRFRRDRRPYEREDKPAPQPVEEPKPEKKSWWKKLIG
ncbi:MAG: Rne/Rng family ribonuclease, partial [Alphaproteobacteria bacterium]|nr:Rne/Rng family ribonuclease [Alphaproteobacteria bacterium]